MPWILFGTWCGVNVLDMLLSWCAFQWGCGELSSLQYFQNSLPAFVALKMFWTAFLGGGFMYRRKYLWLCVATAFITGVCIWNALCIFRQFM